MWKIVVGFVLFAALSMYVIITAGDKADMGGEKHGARARGPCECCSTCTRCGSCLGGQRSISALPGLTKGPASNRGQGLFLW